MLSDRIFYLVKMNVYIVPKRKGLSYTGEYELEFMISPTYLLAAKQKLVYKTVIPALQALDFTMQPG